MKKNIMIALALAVFLIGSSCKKAAVLQQLDKMEKSASTNGNMGLESVISYNWDNVAIGGGGYVTGLVIHPTVANRMYIRTDVGGAYKWDNVNLRWVQLLDGLTTKVDGIALDANAADRVYVALNDGIYRSDDLGATWTKKKALTYDGNGDLRWVGEPIAVDPLTSSIVYAGTRSAGLYRSDDTAGSFTQVASVPTSGNVRCVVVDPATTTGGHSAKVYVAVAGTGIYRSTDGGVTFSALAGAPTSPNRMLVNSGKLYVTHSTGVKVWNGTTWTDITPPTGTGANYVGLSIESFDPLKIAVSQRSGAFGNKIFRSSDGAVNWQQINSTALPVNKTVEVPWWPNTWFSSATSCLAFDPLHHGDLYYTDWFGIWYSRDAWQAGSVDFATREKGHEETVVLTMAAPPGTGTNLYSGMADVNGFRHTSVTAYPTAGMGGMHEITSIAYCETQPANMAILNTSNNDATGIVLKTSTNSGVSFTTRNLPSGAAGGRIAISATDPNKMVYVGRGASGAVYYSTNNGVSFTAATGAPVGAVQGSADIYSKDFALVADCVDGNKFYLFKAGFLYVSTDGGATWTQKNTIAIPNRTSYLFVVARPGVNGEVWISLDGNGLYKTTNSGTTFTKVSVLSTSTAFDFGAASVSGGDATAYCYGTLSGVVGLYRSTDSGTSWDKIDGTQKFSAGVKGLAGDKNIFGRIYVSTGGRGIMYGQP